MHLDFQKENQEISYRSDFVKELKIDEKKLFGVKISNCFSLFELSWYKAKMSLKRSIWRFGMTNRCGFCIFALISFVILSVSACGGDDGGDENNPSGGDTENTVEMGLSCKDEDQSQHCDSNAECKKQEYCGETRDCLSCNSCATYRDCNSDNQEICDPDLGCCVPKNCSDNTDCLQAQICSEGICRDQCCNAIADCGHEGAACLKKAGSTAEVLGYCIIPECWDGTDCADTGYCNALYECDNCTQNSQCMEGTTCEGGICISDTADGDKEVEDVYDCDTYESSCLYPTLQEIVPIQGMAWSDCEKAPGDVSGYKYSFPGTNRYWIRYFDNFNTHDYYIDGELFVRIMVDISAGGIMRYTDKDGNIIGWYGYMGQTGIIRIRCPVDGGDPIEYNFNIEQINLCEGYAGAGIYVAPSDENCPDISSKR